MPYASGRPVFGADGATAQPLRTGGCGAWCADVSDDVALWSQSRGPSLNKPVLMAEVRAVLHRLSGG